MSEGTEDKVNMSEALKPAKDIFAKATGIDAFNRGHPAFPFRERLPKYRYLGSRLFLGFLQAALPTLSAYSRVLYEGAKVSPGGYRYPSEKKLGLAHVAKSTAAMLVDVGTYAFAINAAVHGNPEGGAMFKFYFGNVLGGTAAEHVFRSLGKGDAPQPTSGSTVTR